MEKRGCSTDLEKIALGGPENRTQQRGHCRHSAREERTARLIGLHTSADCRAYGTGGGARPIVHGAFCAWEPTGSGAGTPPCARAASRIDDDDDDGAPHGQRIDPRAAETPLKCGWMGSSGIGH